MAITKNTYSYPVDKEKIVRVSHNESPAHVHNLIHSVDFIVSEGTPVKAAADGIVIGVKFDSDIGGPDRSFEDFGNYVEIEHAYGEYSEYEHLKKGSVSVSVGQRVTRGQVIGLSGSTGWIAHLGPHLHFMVGVYGEVGKNYQTLEISWVSE